MRTLEESLFQKQALREKGCRQTAQAALASRAVTPTPDAAVDSFSGHPKGLGKAQRLPDQRLQPLGGRAGPVLPSGGSESSQGEWFMEAEWPRADVAALR